MATMGEAGETRATPNSNNKPTSFPELLNNRMILAAKGQSVDRIPIWIMRQAGRYLPEFRELRQQHEFFDLCYNPELACEITLQPIKKFDLDAAIIFSDILVVPQALGMEVEMLPGKGPSFPSPLVESSDISKLDTSKVNKLLQNVYDAITLTRHRLQGKVPLIGFTGGPWTLMSYMIEGGGSTTMSKAKQWLYTLPEASHKVLQILTEVNIEYLIKQVVAGAQILMVFESHAGILSPDLYNEFLLPYINKTADAVKERLASLGHDVPMIYFPKGAHFALDSLDNSKYDVIGLDWTMDPVHSRSVIKNKTLQGNLDPCSLYAPKCELENMVKDMVRKFDRSKYIANLGHGIYPDMDPESVRVFIETVHSL